MGYAHSERLSAQDASFLELEDENVHMHIGGVGVYELAPLAQPDGGLDFERILAAADSGLSRSPRLRQKIVSSPLFDHPVWVDDERFNLNYHLRHTCLPFPGDERRLKRLAGRIMSQQLDRGKPLWEMWFVEGVGPDRFAVVTKFHHCLADGLSGLGLMGALIRPDPDPDPTPGREWISRPAPRPADLFRNELSARASAPLRALRSLRRAPLRPADLRGAAERLAATFSPDDVLPASSTPLNEPIGPHRRIDWTRFDMDAAKEVQDRLGGTLNDVVLAVATGALRRFLEARGLRPAELDFRAAVPVNVREEGDRRAGNRVSSLVVHLPVDQVDARRRFARVCERTRESKRSGQSVGIAALAEISDAIFPRLFTEITRLAARLRSTNVVISNVPGPQASVFLLGARMLDSYPVAPLLPNQGLAIAVFSYAGNLFWGINADWDALPDLHQLVGWIDAEFELLCKAASEGPA